MSLPPYQLYKSGDTGGLGLIPLHWQSIKLKHLLSERLTYGANEAADEDDPDQPRYIRITDINSDGSLRSDTFRSLPRHVAQPYILADGDVLLARSGATVGKSLIYRDTWGECCFAGYLIRARPNKEIIDPSFLYAACQTDFYWQHIVGEQIRSTIQNVSAERYASLMLPLPPMSEQKAISAFLDRETAKIDALVDEQRQLIELLKEKRQAVISHAVTKGLDPSAPMKDSGVEWLGEVPAHWEVSHIKRMCILVTDGAHISPETENGVYCFISTKDLSGETIDFEGCLRTSESSYDFLVRSGCKPVAGDVLFSKDGTIGRTVVVRESRDFVVASSLIIIRPNPNEVDSDFLNLLCQSAFVRCQVDRFVKGAGLPRLSIQNLLRVLGVFPPLPDQAMIVRHLTSVLKKADALINTAEAAIGLFQERRSALISAAVTGKIDVRGLVPAEEEAA